MRIALLVLLVAGCAARPVSGFTTIPKDTPVTCENLCRDMGLRLGSVVVIGDQVGCVCDKDGASHAAVGAVMGAMLVASRTDANREEAWAPGF